MKVSTIPGAPAGEGDPAARGISERILAAAADLVARGGAEALTTRAIATAAGCQAPAIYRLFGDKQGLLDALAQRALGQYAARTAGQPRHEDPIEDLRAAWDEHVAFGLAHPAVYRLMSGRNSSGEPSSAAQAGKAALRGRVHRIAQSGRLRVSEERATMLIHAAGRGTVLALLDGDEGQRDGGLSSSAREAVFAAILGPAAAAEPSPTRPLASALRACLGASKVLTPGERLLMDELLRRLSDEG